MTKISIIVAVAHDGAIGRNGDLAFHISEDLRRFKRITMGKPIIMGRKTFESFPNGALPGRRNIVITRQADYCAPGVECASSLEDAVAMVADADEAMVIGGGEIYRLAMPIAETLYITDIDADVAGADTFFPPIDNAAWEDVSHSETFTDPRSGVEYRFIQYNRTSAACSRDCASPSQL